MTYSLDGFLYGSADLFLKDNVAHVTHVTLACWKPKGGSQQQDSCVRALTCMWPIWQ